MNISALPSENSSTFAFLFKNNYRHRIHKRKIFAVHRIRYKTEIKDDNKQIIKVYYKCPYCDVSYPSVTRYEVHLRTHVIIIINISIDRGQALRVYVLFEAFQRKRKFKSAFTSAYRRTPFLLFSSGV